MLKQICTLFMCIHHPLLNLNSALLSTLILHWYRLLLQIETCCIMQVQLQVLVNYLCPSFNRWHVSVVLYNKVWISFVRAFSGSCWLNIMDIYILHNYHTSLLQSMDPMLMSVHVIHIIFNITFSQYVSYHVHIICIWACKLRRVVARQMGETVEKWETTVWGGVLTFVNIKLVDIFNIGCMTSSPAAFVVTLPGI